MFNSKPDERQEELFKILQDAQILAMENSQPGITGGDVDQKVCEFIKEK